MTDAFHIGPVLYCDCAYTGNIADETKRRLLSVLAASGRTVTAVADLCGLAAARDKRLADLAAAEALTIVACHPRAILWLFDWAGWPLDAARVRFLNMRGESLEALLSGLGALAAGEADVFPAPAAEQATPCGEPPGEPQLALRPESPAGSDGQSGGAPEHSAAGPVAPSTWRPWFPVIDFERCVNCRQCLEFCLFGVYDSDASGRVTVRNPSHCKNNCPACARLCPQVAIMFPKIEESSPISGSLEDASQASGKVRLDREQLFGARDALDSLRARRRRPSLLKPPVRQDAHDLTIDPTHARRDG